MGAAIVVSRDLMMRARLEGAARAAGHEVIGADADVAPDVVLIDLDGDDSVERARGLRADFPGARVLGFVSHVDRARWDAAAAAGVEVHPRGASARAASLLGA